MYMKMGRKKIAEYQRKTEAGCFLFASFLGWAKARKGSQVPIVAVTLIWSEVYLMDLSQAG